ncbi:MAG: response regulator [Pirellulales bacterium]
MTPTISQERILEYMPDGVVVLDSDHVIQWANQQFRRWTQCEDPIERDFYEVLDNPELLGPDYCPFNTALVMGEASGARIRTKDNRFFHFHVAPVRHDFLTPQQLIVTMREVTQEVLQLQMMEAIHKAGAELAKMLPEEVGQMTVDERIEHLKQNIVHFTQHLLHFDVIEIRLLNPATQVLTPLLSFGLDRAAAVRELKAEPVKNGVTGFVAASGKSYLCEDTARDPLYIEGFKGAKSSMTVPLMLHEQVIGTFNVESPNPRAFMESDLQFLEIFSRDVANALNTLDLLHAQQIDTALQSVEAIHREVAKPIDEILNTAVLVMERYVGKDCPDWARMREILENARTIKKVIYRVGQSLAPAEAIPATTQSQEKPRPRLRDRRILVVDADDTTRKDAHNYLEKFGCVVETAQNGTEANLMIRNCGPLDQYDIVMSDILLSDMTGYELMQKLKPIYATVPLILMKGYGYDPRHVVADARSDGLHEKALVAKPLRRDQVIDVVEIVLEWLDRGAA